MKEKLCQMTAEYAGRPTTTVTLEIPVDLLEHVKEAAALEGSDHQAIINCYVKQGLINSKAEVKRLQFAEHAKDVLGKHGVEPHAIDEIFTKFLY